MRTVFFDVDTQIDFLYPAGALYVPGAEQLHPALARLTRFARENSIPVISTMDAHAENDQEFRDWPPHCVAGTLGQGKPRSTLLDRRVVVPLAKGNCRLEGAQQAVIEKQSLNCFTNPNLESVMDELGAERYVVYGVVTEYCVRLAAEGLLRTGREVEIVQDAIQTLKSEDGTRALAELASAGARLTSVASSVSSSCAG